MSARGIRLGLDHATLTLAENLIRLGARTGVTQGATQLPRATVNALYRDIHGRSPSSGPPLQRAISLARFPWKHLQAALYATIYSHGYGGQDALELEADRVIAAFQTYQRLQPLSAIETDRLDINAAWVIARDLQARGVELQFCPHCSTPYLVASDRPALSTCPFCRLLEHPPSLVTAQRSPVRLPQRRSNPVSKDQRASLKSIRTLSDRRRLALAVRLLQHEARTSLVQAATGLPNCIVRGLHHHLHGTRPASGQLPFAAGYLTRPFRRHLHAMLFAVIYQQLGGQTVRTTVDANLLVAAYELYLKIRPTDGDRYGIGFTDAWVLARDLRTGLARLKACCRCGSSYLIAADMPRAPACPVCTLAARATARLPKPRRKRDNVGMTARLGITLEEWAGGR